MKTIKSLFAVLLALLAFSACEKDGDKIYLQSLESNDLMATASRVELNAGLDQEIVVSLAWTDRTVRISDSAVGTTATVTNYVEASLSEDFSTAVSRTATTSLSIAFTGLELNSLANEIGAVTGQNNKVYFRLAGTTGTNIPPVYSNVISIDVTPYEMDMNTGIVILSNDQAENLGETGVTFHSPDADGIYSGFISIPEAWYHILLKEGDGSIWGTSGSEGAFHLTDDPNNSLQNMWFPGTAGCYYVIIDTQAAEWSALHISSLSVSGLTDGNVDLKLDQTTNQWLATFNAPAAGSHTITVSGQGEQYNAETGDGSGTAVGIAFASDGEQVSLAETAGNITVDVPQAGECTVRINLYDPTNCTVSVEAGAAGLPGGGDSGEDTPATLPESLDVVSYSTGPEVVLTTLRSTGNGVYTGTYSGEVRDKIKIVDRTNSVWYGCTEGNISQLSSQNSWDIWFDGSGAVTLTVDLNNMTWSYTTNTEPETLDVVSYSTGSEVVLTKLRSTGNGVYTGTYTGEVRDQINIVDRTNSVWYGCDGDDNSKLSSQDDKWNIWFGGSGAVTLTVDLTNMTWNYTAN